jgi:hypothetical protein
LYTVAFSALDNQHAPNAKKSKKSADGTVSGTLLPHPSSRTVRLLLIGPQGRRSDAMRLFVSGGMKALKNRRFEIPSSLLWIVFDCFERLSGARRLASNGIETYAKKFLTTYQNAVLWPYQARCCADSAPEASPSQRGVSLLIEPLSAIKHIL